MKTIKWYHYIAAFFAAMFLTNAIPHFVQGICGNLFPSPFSDPPGKGPSTPVVNVLWGVLNLVIGYLLFRAGKISSHTKILLVVFFAGMLVMGLMLANTFTHKAI